MLVKDEKVHGRLPKTIAFKKKKTLRKWDLQLAVETLHIRPPSS
jgi:hypothetical protein